jgi:hypothetical protein
MAAIARSALEWDFIDSARKNSPGSWLLLVVASGWGRIGFKYCAIYQLVQNKKNREAHSYAVLLGATGRTRTADLLITNQLLYQLSHSSKYLFFTAYQ